MPKDENARNAHGGPAAPSVWRARAAATARAVSAAAQARAGAAAQVSSKVLSEAGRRARRGASTLADRSVRLGADLMEAARRSAERARVAAPKVGAGLARFGAAAAQAALKGAAGAQAAVSSSVSATASSAASLWRGRRAPSGETLPAPVESGFGQAEALIGPALRGAAGRAPVQILRGFDRVVTVRATLTIWSRLDMRCERLPGERPEGRLAADAEAARTALTPSAQAALGRGIGAAGLRRRLERDPWIALAALQGEEAGPALTETVSVLRDCPDCDGRGGFSCAECDGSGRCACARCDGAGRVDAECPDCRGAVRPGAHARVALDPDAAAILIQNQAATGGGVAPDLREAAARGVDPQARREGCARCAGAGAIQEECASCAGAGARRCRSCEGAGRSACETCAGTGRITERHQGRARYERSAHLALEPVAAARAAAAQAPAPGGPASESRALAPLAEEEATIPDAALSALRAGWPDLAAARGLDFKMTSFQNSGFACQAVFEARAPLVGLAAIVGRKSRRLRLDFWGLGAPLTLLAPPKALDHLHRWRVDEARLSSVEGRRRALDALAGAACGRAALRAAARRDRRLPEGAFGPMASDEEAARMLRLAQGAHQAAGWRVERWVWGGAALLAAPLGWLIGRGLEDDAVPQLARRVAAGVGAGENAASFWAQAAALTAPFLALWLGAGLVAAIAHHRETRRLLGFARPRSLSRLFFGAAPATALAVGVAAYGAALGVDPTRWLPRSAAPTAPATLAAAAGPGGATALAAVAETPAAAADLDAQAAEAEARRAFLENAKPDRWRERAGLALVRSTGSEALLAARCEKNRLLLRLETDAVRAFGEGRPPRLVWRTEVTALNPHGLGLELDDEGAPAALFWSASPAALAALRRDARLRVLWSDGEAAEGRHEFTLQGSSLALGAAMAACGAESAGG